MKKKKTFAIHTSTRQVGVLCSFQMDFYLTKAQVSLDPVLWLQNPELSIHLLDYIMIKHACGTAQREVDLTARQRFADLGDWSPSFTVTVEKHTSMIRKILIALPAAIQQKQRLYVCLH